MRQPVNLARLSPLRRGFVLGFVRAKRQARKELARQAADFDAELVSLQQEFDELALAHHRKCLNDAIDEARIERATYPDMLLH